MQSEVRPLRKLFSKMSDENRSSYKQKIESTTNRNSSPNTSSLKKEKESKKQTQDSKATTSTTSDRLTKSDSQVSQKKLLEKEKLEGNDSEGLDERLGTKSEFLRPSPSSTSLSIHSKASDNASVRSWAVSSTSYQKLADIDERELEVHESKSDMCLPRLKTISSSFRDLRPIVQEDDDSSSESSYTLQRQDRKKKFRKKTQSNERQGSSHDSDENMRAQSTSTIYSIREPNFNMKLKK